MITCSAWAGKRYAVLGLARSGTATVAALVASGARLTAWDADEARRLPFSREGGSPTPPSPLDPRLLGGTVTVAPLDDLSTFDALVVSPGVPLNTHPLAARARAAGVPIIGDIELFAQARAELPPHRVVGITGTNGKSTTTALVHHILRTAGVPSLMGGNIGLPILAQEPLPEGGVYVLELSSYQIDLTFTLDCDVAVLTNITPDHLDRYDGFEAYVNSKLRLFLMQNDAHDALIAEDDIEADEVVYRLEHEFNRWKNVSQFHCGSIIKRDEDETSRQRLWPSLRGSHNAQNASAAIEVARVLGVDGDLTEQALRTFAGLPHRTQRIAEVNGIAFVDDSKATNPESTAPALAAFPRVHWIVGGRAKGDDLEACRPGFPHVARAYTIGEAGPRFAAWLREAGVSVGECGTLEVAVNAAFSAARPGETVLLSPAAASFDQFRDYEHRGAEFRRFVEALA